MTELNDDDRMLIATRDAQRRQAAAQQEIETERAYRERVESKLTQFRDLLGPGGCLAPANHDGKMSDFFALLEARMAAYLDTRGGEAANRAAAMLAVPAVLAEGAAPDRTESQ